MIFLFDGSVDGLFTAIYDAYYFKAPEHIYNEKFYQLELGVEYHRVETMLRKSEKVQNSILEKLSEITMTHILKVLLSEQQDSVTSIYKFLKIAFKRGPGIIDDLSDPIIMKFRDYSRMVARETHLLVGLLRFKKLDNGIYYCEFSPSYDQVRLLSSHFADRLNDQYWIIHDVSRHYASFYDKNNWYTKKVDMDPKINYDKDELKFQGLWKEYFEKIAIEERKSEKRQMAMMPKKYWKHLVEFDN
ncbi:MAG: TIGR03915 family putative DNA repair protein [Acidaminobacteraceae bacterium]